MRRSSLYGSTLGDEEDERSELEELEQRYDALLLALEALERRTPDELLRRIEQLERIVDQLQVRVAGNVPPAGPYR